nr:ribonuclease H-like domain-containing protein [Tanacetum cinerariifolium]
IPSESKDFSDIESECDIPDCDDCQTTTFSTFSNPLFDDSTSSDDESSHEEVIYEMSFKTYSNPLFDLDEEIISSEFNPIHNEDLDSTLKNNRFDTKSYLLESLLNRDTLMASSPKFDSLLEEFSGELAHIDLIPPGINEAFYDDHVKEISGGSTTTHSDSSLYDSFIFDLSINPFPPTDRSDFYEFADELTHIISPPDAKCKEKGVGLNLLLILVIFLLLAFRVDAVEKIKEKHMCVSAANVELTAAKHKLMLLVIAVQNVAAVADANPQVVSAAKLPILNPNEFNLWMMRIEQYFLMTDYYLWEVILNGNSPVPTRLIDGVAQPVAPTTVKHKLARKNELKAR